MTAVACTTGALLTFGGVFVMSAGVMLEKQQLIDGGFVAELCGCVAYIIAVGGESILP